jgi:O-antigen ligase/polysaccharide polymerase Wzy-like membrane protein/PDZ domain-containing protein
MDIRSFAALKKLPRRFCGIKKAMATNDIAGAVLDADRPRPAAGELAAGISRNLQAITAFFLFLFVIAQPLSIAASHVAYAGAALAWVLRLVLMRRGALKSSPLDLPILIYLVLCAVSTLLSPMPASSWEGMRKIALIFVVLVVAQNVPNLRRARQLLAVLFISALFAAAWAGWNYVHGVGLRIHSPQPNTNFYRAGIRDDDVILRVDGRNLESPQEFLRELDSEPVGQPMQLRVVHGGGIEIMKDAVPVSVPLDAGPRPRSLSELGMVVQTDRPARARAFYSHYVTYAAVLQLLACLVFGLWLAHRRYSPLSSAIFAGLLLVFVIALGMTLTRAAWLSFAFGCVVELFFFLRHWTRNLIIPAVLIVAVAGTSLAMHRWRGTSLVNLRDPGDDYRLLMWRDGAKLIEAHPLFGVGMNVVRDAPARFELAAYRKYAGWQLHFHSTPIEIGVELGLLVLAAWGALMAAFCWMLVRLVRESRKLADPFPYGLSLGILGATSSFLSSSVVHYDFGDSVVVFLLWFLAGLALALHYQLKARGRQNAASAGAAA